MRAWCLQEIVMAKEASIYLGNVSMDCRKGLKVFWTCYGFWALKVGGKGDPRLSKLFQIAMRRLPQNFFVQLAVIEQTRLPTFLEMLTNNGNLLTTDPRDEIYSFLGLVDPADPYHSGPTMIPDYTKRLSDLLIRVIIHLLKHHSLDILSFATVRLIPKKFIHDVFFLPKWAPDWRDTSLTEGAHFAFTTFSWPRILLRDL
jgi:hypothetical protein